MQYLNLYSLLDFKSMVAVKSPFLSRPIGALSAFQLLKSPTMVTCAASGAASLGSLKVTLHLDPPLRYCLIKPSPGEDSGFGSGFVKEKYVKFGYVFKNRSALKEYPTV